MCVGGGGPSTAAAHQLPCLLHAAACLQPAARPPELFHSTITRNAPCTRTHPIPLLHLPIAPTQVLGDRLHCVFVDNGLLRFKEGERVMQTFNEHLHLPVTKIDDAGGWLSVGGRMIGWLCASG